jgi:hypothetical protein
MSDLVMYGETGPVFERACPKCRRYMKFPLELAWRETFSGRCEWPEIECARCGPVKPEHVGWAEDYRG